MCKNEQISNNLVLVLGIALVPVVLGLHTEYITVPENYSVLLNCTIENAEAYSWMKVDGCSSSPTGIFFIYSKTLKQVVRRFTHFKHISLSQKAFCMFNSFSQSHIPNKNDKRVNFFFV